MNRNIPGRLGMAEMALLYGTADQYQRRAEQHRPTDRAAIEREVTRMFVAGMGVDAIATALRLDPAAVRNALGPDSTPTPRGGTHDEHP